MLHYATGEEEAELRIYSSIASFSRYPCGSSHMVTVSEVQLRGEEPVNVNVKNGMKTAVTNPLMLVVSMWCVPSAISCTSATSHWIIVSGLG